MLTLITIGNLLPWPQYKPSPEQGISTVVVGNPTEESDLCSALMQNWTIQNSCSRILKSQLFHTFWGQMRKDGKITEKEKVHFFMHHLSTEQIQNHCESMNSMTYIWQIATRISHRLGPEESLQRYVWLLRLDTLHALRKIRSQFQQKPCKSDWK